MNILIVSFYDDNFGDNLIKICFRKILEVTLENLKIKNYDISEMPLKRINEELIKNSNVIFFAGGGLLGLSYLNFFEYLEKIISLADKNNIPVIFSSVGVNNMDATEENEIKLKELLSNKCIKAISVRENLEFFDKYLDRKDIKVVKVCDPAVWTKYVYHNIVIPKKKNIIGINVVRGGLFKDNDKSWTLSTEMNYLNEVIKSLEEKGYDYKLYTNGSFLDNNTLKHYVKKYNIPLEKMSLPDTTKEFVETVAQFNLVLAIRMHSSIVSYSYNIPSIALVWNNKIPYFYENIGKRDNIIDIEKWKLTKTLDFVDSNYNKKFYDNNEEYLMTVYNYLYNLLKEFSTDKGNKIYVFDEVVEALKLMNVSKEEDILDYKIKLKKAADNYLSRFREVKDKESKLKKMQERIDVLNKNIEKNNETINKLENSNALLKKELDKLNKSLVIRVEKKLKGITKKVIKKG